MQKIPLEEMQTFIVKKTKRIAEQAGDRLPSGTTGSGKLKYTENCGWTGGFWTGLLYYCYLLTGDTSFFDLADKSRFRFLNRLYQTPETLDQDVGFLYIPSEYARYKLQGKAESRKVVLDAAESMLSRYVPKGRYILAWNDWGDGTEVSLYNKSRIIIDSMYNLPLLYWASQETGETRFADAASAHAETCSKTLVREDGTTFHTYIFDLETGAPKFGKTFQGYSDDSCWARGQTWALGGFAMAYRFTGNPAFLEVSKKTANVYLDLLEPDYIPVWDFIFKGQDVPRDASAAAIAASGLLELASHCTGDEKERYQNAAKQMVLALWNGYTSRNDADFNALIERCVGFHESEGYEFGENVIYADYYFAEAVAKLKGLEAIL